jgi:hypothetical protein
MGYKQNQGASKGLLLTLVVVAVAGAIFFAMKAAGGGGEGSVEGVPPVPDNVKNLPPATPQPGEPGAVTPK